MAERHGRLVAASILIGILTWAVGFAPAQDSSSKLATTEWLASNIRKPGIRVVDVRPDLRDYWVSHIPSAVHLHPETLRWPEQGAPARFLPVKNFVDLLGVLGVDRETTVVVYAEESGFMPLYFAWALEYIGHTKFMLLDGGFKKWKAEDRFLTQDFPVIRPTTYPMPLKPNEDIRATLDEVRQALGTETVLLDVRPPEMYSGEKGTWKQRGHVRGAVSHFWNTDLDSGGRLKSRNELLQDYARIGVTPDKRVIVMCGSGQMSSHTYFVLKHILGFPRVSSYDGGFSEWSSKDLPVESTKK